ncbi:TRAPP subunit bet5 [Serendipita sp. 398]|nr:TRAPP subunit bet5 [Serendipita sp. 398]
MSKLPFDEEAKLVYGVIFSLRGMVQKLSGRDESFVNYKTSSYKLHVFETITGYKFVLLTDPTADSMRFTLRQIYVGPFLEYVSNALARRWYSDNSPEDNTTSSSETTPSKSPDFSPFQTPSANKKVGRNVPKGVVVAPPPTNVLPELPAKPRYPCKHLSDDEVKHYLRPLYERGWGIFTRLPNQEHPVPTLQLARDIHFIWHFALLEFIRELNVITAAEMHHPKVSYEYQILEIRTQTHTATLNNSKPGNEPEENRDTKILAGVTLRDVRSIRKIGDLISSKSAKGANCTVSSSKVYHLWREPLGKFMSVSLHG